MNPKVSFTLVGLFVMVLGGALAAGVVWLSTAKGEKGYTLYVAYVNESVSGLNPNASVSYTGVDVGRVKEIELDRENPQRVRLLLEIEEGTPIKQDTVATLVTQGITGVAHVELRGGSRESPPLEVDEQEGYPVIETIPSLFTRLDMSITGLVDQLQDAVASLKNVADRIAMTLTEENQEAISSTMAHVDDVTDTMTRIALTVESTMHEVETTTRNVAVASDALPDLLDRTGRTVSAYEDTARSLTHTAQAVMGTAGAITDAIAELVVILRETQADLAPFSRGVPAQLVGLVGELEQLGSSLRRLVQDLERDPNMLLFGRPLMAPGPGE